MTEQTESERESFDLNNTDFYIWDYDKLVEYHEELARTVASLKSQIDRNNLRLEYFHDCRDELRNAVPFEKVYDERWRKGVVYSLHLAEAMLAEVTRRIAVLDVRRGQ